MQSICMGFFGFMKCAMISNVLIEMLQKNKVRTFGICNSILSKICSNIRQAPL